MSISNTIVRILIPFLVWFRGADAVTPCTTGATSGGPLLTISYIYYANGDIVVNLSNTVWNSDGSACAVSFTKYAGQTSNLPTIGSGDCSGSTTTFTFTAPTQYKYLPFGSTSNDFTAQVVVTGASTPSSSYCTTTYTTTPPQCSNGGTTALTVSKFPLGRIEAQVANGPISSKCVFFQTQWNGSTTSDYTFALFSAGFVDCTATAYLKNGSTAMGAGYHNAIMVQYDTGASYSSTIGSTVGVVCGVNPPTPVHTPLCTDPSAVALAMSTSAYATITATITTSSISAGTICRFNVLTWADTDETNSITVPSTSSGDACASPVSITQPSLQFLYGSTKNYVFELEVVTSGAVTCFLPTSTSSLTVASTDLTCANTDLTYRWLGVGTVRLTVTTPPETYGYCTVTFTNDAAGTTTTTGAPCTTGNFDFADSIYLANGKTGTFVYQFYGSGSTSGHLDCTSSPVVSKTIQNYECGSITTSSPTSEYVFTLTPGSSVTNPATDYDTGTCQLDVSCTYQSISYGGHIALNSCSSYTVSFFDLSTAVGYVPSGATCTYQYEYRAAAVPSSVYCISPATTAATLSALPCYVSTTAATVSASYFTDGKFSVTATGPPTPTSDQTCYLELTEYNGNTLSTPVSYSAGGAGVACATSHTFAVPSGYDFRFGAEYGFRLRIKNVVDVCVTSGTTTPPICTNSGATTLAIGKYPLGQIQATLTNVDTSKACGYYLTKWNDVEMAEPVAVVDPCDTSAHYISETLTSIAMAYGTHEVMVQLVPTGTTLTNLRTSPSTIHPTCGTTTMPLTTTKCTTVPTFTESTTTYGDLVASVTSTPAASTKCKFTIAKWAGTALGATDESVTSTTCTSATALTFGSPVFSYGTQYNLEYELYATSGTPSAGTGLTCYVASADLSYSPSITCAGTDITYYWMGNGNIRVTLNTLAKPFSTNYCDFLVYGHTATHIAGTCSSTSTTFDLPTDTAHLGDGSSVGIYYTLKAGGSSSAIDCTSSNLSFTVHNYDCSGGYITTSGTPSTGYTFTVVNPSYSSAIYNTYDTIKLNMDCTNTATTGTANDAVAFTQGSTTLASQPFSTLSSAFKASSVNDYLTPSASCTFGYDYWVLGGGSAFCSTTIGTSATTLNPSSCIVDNPSWGLASFTVSYTDAALFAPTVQTVGSVPAGKSCRYSVIEWAGAFSAGATHACTGSFTLTGAAPITYGTDYKIALEVYDNTNTGLVYCQDSVTTSPPVCRNSISQLSVLNVVKSPYDNIKTYVSKRPATGTCVYMLTKWNSAPETYPNPHSGFVDCASSYSFSPSTITLGDQFSARMISYSTAATDISVDQPVCGLNALTVTPPQCSFTGGSIFESDYGVVQVTISSTPIVGMKCSVNLVTWNGNPASTYTIRRQSEDCTSVKFSAHDVGAAFSTGSAYVFEISQFNDNDDIDLVNPQCSLSVSQTIAAPSCTSQISSARTDSESVQITVATPFVFGLCVVELTSYASSPPATTIKQVGACDSDFDFLSDGSTITYASGTSVTFSLKYYDNSDITSTAVCSTTSTFTLDDYFTSECLSKQLSVFEAPTGTYTFSIADPKPLLGSCKLNLSDTASSTSYQLPWTNCAASKTITISDVITAFGGSFTAGDPFTASFTYYNTAGSASCTTAATAPTLNVRALVALTQVTSSSGEVIVQVGSLPSTISGAFTAPYCVIDLIGCDGSTSGATSITVSPCTPGTSQHTFSASPVTSDSNCQFDLKVWPTTAIHTADTGLTMYGGYSGVVTFSSAGAPSWGASQSVTVETYGQNCLKISWDAPTTVGGAPILCYSVDRKDSTGDYYEVQACDNSLVSEQWIINCSYNMGTDYQFKVTAENRVGTSSLESAVIRTENLLMAYQSLYTVPTTYVFSAGNFPIVQIHARSQLSGGTADTTTTSRLFVGTLVNQCTSLDATNTIPQYATVNSLLVGPLTRNANPALTKTFHPLTSSAGYYELTVASSDQPPAGKYSLLTYSLQPGGLFAQYFANPFLTAPAAATQVDPIMDFYWGNDPIINTTSTLVYDLVSIRWNGFVEALFSETYTLHAVTSDYVRIWINDVLIVNSWDNECSGVCTGQVDLEQSIETPGNPSSRIFNHIRIDYYHVKGIAQIKPASFSLYWSSFSQGYQVIPAAQLYAGRVINNQCFDIEVTPGALDGPSSYATIPSTDQIAGVPFNILITAKDAYGNILQSGDSSFSVTLHRTDQDYTFSSQVVTVGANDGLYYIPVTLTSAGDYSVNAFTCIGCTGGVTTSATTVNVVAGPPSTTFYYSFTPTAPEIAGTTFTVSMSVADSYTNTLSSTSPMPDIYLSAVFTGDESTQGLLPYDDTNIRVQRYGTTFTQDMNSIGYSSGFYTATLTLPFSGGYTIDMGIVGSTPSTQTVTVLPQTAASGIFAVVLTTPFPPTELTIGTAVTYIVQMRDQYMNIITGQVVPESSVILQASQMADTTCNQPSEGDGTYVCTFTPSGTGSTMQLGILVDGVYASYLNSDSGIIENKQGPYTVTLNPGSIDPASCVVTGIKSVYVVDVAASITITYKDANGNNVGVQPNPTPTILVKLGQGASYETMSSMTFNSDGTVTVTILPTTTFSGGNMIVTVNGVAVSPLNFPAFIDVINGSPNSASSLCTDMSGTITAGSTFSYQCTIKDAGLNALDRTNLDLDTYYELTTDTGLGVITNALTYNSANALYEATTVAPLTVAGTYSFYTLMGQIGGLLGQYYSQPNFNNLIGIGGTPLSDSRFANEPPVQYTRIDPYLDFNWEGNAVIDGVIAESIVWTGYIRPTTLGVSHTYQITAYGGVRVTVGTTVAVNLLSATIVFEETFVVAPITNTPESITIEYIPGDASARIEFKQLEGSIYKTVPPSILQAPLRVPHAESTYAITVTPRAVSPSSIAIVSSPYIENTPEQFAILPKDDYGNSWTTNCLTLSTDACLWRISLVDSSGATYIDQSDLGATVAYNANGLLTVSITFTVSGPEYIKIELSTNAGTTYTEIAGSPYFVTVNAQ